MTIQSSGVHFSTRLYENVDEGQVLELLNASLGEGPAGARTSEFFRWKHLDNPFGHSFMLVAEADGDIVGLRAFMRWVFESPQGPVTAVRAVDTSTHPSFQRMGLFRTMTLEALEALRANTDLVFNTPNDKSRPGYLKMGWEQVGRIPVGLRVRRPLRVASKRRSSSGHLESKPLVEALEARALLTSEGVDDLLRHSERYTSGLATLRDLAFLQWRYGDAPLLDYRAISAGSGGRIDGLVIFRVRSRGALWETTVSELVLREGATSVARSLLRQVVEAAPVDHLVCSFPRRSASARAALATRFVRLPSSATLVANVLRQRVALDPLKMSSWALTCGDVEVF